MRTLALLLASLLMAGCSGCASLPPGKPSYHAAIRMEFDDGLCSGTAIGSRTILSAAHCFSQPAGVAKFNGQHALYQIVADDKRDHVLVHVTMRLNHVAKVGKAPKWGQMLSLIGNPLGFYSLLRMGRVAGWEDDFQCPDESNGCRVMLADLETAGGDSGSGYFNARGEVVGVHSGSTFKGPWSLAYSYPLAFTDEQMAAII